jgi:cytoskeletal protein CcmA (bactofilin family)
MSFRKFGGLQYAATHNIVKSNVNTTDSFYVTKNIGQPNTYINFESDISGNIIIYGDLDVSGNLHVTLDIDCSGNVNIDGDVDINGNLHVQEDIDCSGNVNIAGDVDINKNLHVQEDIDCSGNVNIAGDVDINGNLHVQENIDCSGNITAEYMFLSSGTTYTTSPNGVVPKSYVDSVANGLTTLPPCLLCSNAGPIILSGYGQIIDGFTISSVYDASAVLVNSQGGQGVDASSNGIYIVSSGSWQRASYLDTGDKATGTATLILQGTTYADHRFVCTTGSNTSPAFIGIVPVIWNIFDSPFSLGQGLSKINIGNNTVVQVDSSLNFINYLDNTAGGTINIGTNTNTINIGSTTNAINIAGDIDCSGNLYVKKNIDCSGNLYVQNDAYINNVRVGTGGGNNSSNTVVGYNSLSNNTIGLNNTVVGYNSLSLNTTGANNTAIGPNSLPLNTSGSTNVAIGIQTLQNNTSGYSNTAINSGALYNNTTGASNTAIGQNALILNTIGENNVAIGSSAGVNLSGDSNFNTFLGPNTDVSPTTLICSNSTAVGYGALIDASNQIVLGTQAETVFVPGNVGIGTSISAGAYLSVNTKTTGNDMNAPDIDTSKGNGLLITSAKTGISPYSMGLGVDYATGNGFISCAGNGGFTSLLLNPRGNGGKVGIGTTTPAYTLDVSGTVQIQSSSTWETQLNITNTSISPNPVTYQLLVGGSANNIGAAGVSGFGIYSTLLGFVFNINSNGNVGINNTSPQYKLDVGGNVNATSYNSSSDYRIKKDVVALDDTFSVDKLRPVTYNNINLGKQDIGLIAHELQEIYPFLVTGEKDGENLQSVNYIGLIGILIKEIQELKKDIRLLKEKFI